MRSQTVRIGHTDHAALTEMAEASGKSMAEILSEAIHEFRRIQLLKQTNEAYARLKSDPKAWEEEIRERELWETTLTDGLE